MPQDRPSQAQLLTQLRYAIELEQQSYRRYTEAAKLTRDEKVRKLLRYLAKQELTHEEKLRNLLGELEAAQGD